jgi:hypothetical protein
MTWEQIQSEALRSVDEVAQRRSDLELTEFQNEERYRIAHPKGLSMRNHNPIVRAAMREATRSGIYCHRRLVR